MKKLFPFSVIVPIVCFTAIVAYSDDILTWQKCVSIALRNNPELESARESIKTMKAKVGITRSPNLPQIGANLSGSRNKQTYNSISNTGNKFSYGITGKQLLFDGKKTSNDVNSARKLLEASIYEYRVISSNLRLNLRTAYAQVLKAKNAYKIAGEIAKRRKQNLDLVMMRYEAGREHKGSLLTAKANLAQAEYEVSSASRNILLSQKLLVKYMGLREFMPLTLKEEIPVPELAVKSPDFTMLAESNPLLQQVIMRKESAKYNMESAKSTLFPSVYAFLNAGRSDSKWPPEGNEWSAGVQMDLPLFQGGKRYYDISAGKSEYRRLISEVRNTKDSVVFTLEQKWINLKNAVDRIKVQHKYLTAAEERSKISEAQYSIGVITFDNWIIIEDNLVNIKKNYLEARIEAMISMAEWLQAKGETLEYDEKK